VVKFSVTQWIYGEESLETTVKRLSKFNYDGIELKGEPKEVNVRETKQLLKKYGLEVSSICGIYTPERDLINANEKIRRNAIRYVKDCIEMAANFNAKVVIVVPSAVTKTRSMAPLDMEWNWAIESLKEVGDYGAELSVILALEALNRFETYFVNKMDQLLRLMKDVNSKNVRVMADTFHMNIEEVNLAEAIRRADKNLVHVHLSDSNRQAVGMGHIDFHSIVNALKDISYDRYLTMEFLPPAADPYIAIKGFRDVEFYDTFTRESIEFTKKIWAEVK